MEIAAQYSINFPDEKCVAWKKKKKTLIIYDTIQLIYIKLPFNQFTLSFHQNNYSVSGHLILITDDLVNVSQGQNLKKNLVFDMEIFRKNSQCQISLSVLDSQKISKVI